MYKLEKNKKIFIIFLNIVYNINMFIIKPKIQSHNICNKIFLFNLHILFMNILYV